MPPLTANAYLGAWGIAEALSRGADIVVTGRVTDASVVVGPAAWHFGWARDDWDRLAGAVVAGHVIECGAQATGGNYSSFQEVPGLEHPGFPIAEVHADGSSIITKHPGTGGLVSVGTVTAQLCYEIGGPLYLNPDVTTDLSTVRLAPAGDDRVRVSDVRGYAPTTSSKVCINTLGGFRNRMTFLLTGLDIEDKADLVRRTFARHVDLDAIREVSWQLVRSDHADAASNAEAIATLTVTAKDGDAQVVGRRAFANVAVEMALASYPGFTMTAPPGDAEPFGIYWPALVPEDRDHGGGRPRRRHPRRGGAHRRHRRGSAGRGARRPHRRDGARPATPRVSRSAGWSTPAAATRAATPTSVCGCATTPPTPGCRRPHGRAVPHAASPTRPTSRSTATSSPTSGR